MILRYIFLLMLAGGVAFAQEPFGDGKVIHTRTLFSGEAAIDIPDSYSLASTGTAFYADENGESLVDGVAVYSHNGYKEVVSCFLLRDKLSQHDVKKDYTAFKAGNNGDYQNILRDEFVAEGDNSYYYYECELKDEFYNESGDIGFEKEDGTVLPNYFLCYYVLHNGKAAHIVIHYDGKMAGQADFREQAYTIIR
ncbi:MAG: hypothetical protein KDC07_11645, partial [Chitinophagaceae bacterium]|nr:hypothetical protein [Chitinophagaceae bacterium]